MDDVKTCQVLHVSEKHKQNIQYKKTCLLHSTIDRFSSSSSYHYKVRIVTFIVEFVCFHEFGVGTVEDVTVTIYKGLSG